MATDSDIKQNKPSSMIQPAPKSHLSVRIMGFFILFIEFGLLFVYGFQGYILNQFTSWGASLTATLSNALVYTYQGYIFYFIMLIFTIIGFGCLYAANSRTTLSGFFISFFIVGFTTIFSPVLQKFWFNVFSGSFSPTSAISTDITVGQANHLHYSSGSDIWISFYVMRISLLNAISQLIVFYGLYHKLNIAQVFFFSIFYQLAWTLNYFLNVQVSRFQPQTTHRFFDDYAINQVFLFASVFALVVCLLVKKPPQDDLKFGRRVPKQVSGSLANLREQNQQPLIVSLIGTFLLYITFMGITLLYPVKTSNQFYFSPQTFMNILFALSACVFTNMFLTSAIKNKFGIRQIHFGMIGGAIICGSIAGTLDNIGAMMALGTFAGIISSLYFGFIHPKINKNNIFDTYGIFYIFIVSLFGTMFVAPIVLLGMYKNNVLSNTLNNVLVSTIQLAGWSLVYVGISVGVALVTGLIIGLFLKCLGRQILKQFDDQNIFIPLPGLNDQAYIVNRSRIMEGANQTGTYLNADNIV